MTLLSVWWALKYLVCIIELLRIAVNRHRLFFSDQKWSRRDKSAEEGNTEASRNLACYSSDIHFWNHMFISKPDNLPVNIEVNCISQGQRKNSHVVLLKVCVLKAFTENTHIRSVNVHYWRNAHWPQKLSGHVNQLKMCECKKTAQIKGEISICLQTPLSLISSYLMKRHVKCSLSVQMLFGVIVYL